MPIHKPLHQLQVATVCSSMDEVSTILWTKYVCLDKRLIQCKWCGCHSATHADSAVKLTTSMMSSLQCLSVTRYCTTLECPIHAAAKRGVQLCYAVVSGSHHQGNLSQIHYNSSNFSILESSYSYSLYINIVRYTNLISPVCFTVEPLQKFPQHLQMTFVCSKVHHCPAILNKTQENNMTYNALCTTDTHTDVRRNTAEWVII